MATTAEADRPRAAIRDARAGLRRLGVEPVAGVLAAVVVIGLLAHPLLLGGTDRGWDYYSHLWYIWHQSESLRANGVPSLFLHDANTTFNPHYAFYGGTLYAAAGLLAIAFGSVETGYVVSWLLGFAAAYGGWFWLARSAGLGRWWAHVPAVLFVSSPYYLGLSSSRGAWPELVAVSMIPLFAASALSVLRADRLRSLPVLALVVSTAFLFGSHNITMLWGTTVLLVLAAVICLCVPEARRQVTVRGVVRVAVVLAPAALVDAWFLLPDVAYQSQTYIGGKTEGWQEPLRGYDHFVDADHLLSLGRATADPGQPNFALQLPVLAIAWAVLALPVLRPRGAAPWARTLVVLLAAGAGLVLLMTSAGLLLALPAVYGLVQFSFRLESYVLLAFVGAVLAALVLAGGTSPRRRLWAWAIVPVLVVSVIQGARQVDLHRTPVHFVPPLTAAAPYSPKDEGPGVQDYAGYGLPEVTGGHQLTQVRFPPSSAEHGGRASVVVDAQPGQLLYANVMTVPELVELHGARFAAVAADGRHNILEVAPDATPGAARLTLRAAAAWPVVFGRVLSVAGLAGLAALAAAMLLAARRRRRGWAPRPD
ncbi:MAG TPA: hypothetical protein VK501_14285 [Baekduia sp.]|uniref:hypothetical protein n=1 Tax=Baekduia sp. TaxID=2600305 RepID=UPI002BC5AAF6|nr:hypothetical protein [Baekduia sp.]HMJ35075.1 hypothetical protein [Baekduia sp.]